jgi:hypothetical protein
MRHLRNKLARLVTIFYADFHAFKFSPSSNSVADVWNKGYQVITIINDLLRVKSENFNDKINLFAGLKTIRAYTYLTLLNYYGNIVMVPETATVITTPLSNTNKQQIITHIDTDLSTANTVLEPLGKTPEINTYTIQALKAKLALHQKKYEQVRDYAHSIILSKAYTLENKSSVFNIGSKEMIWQLADITNTALKNFLNNRPTFPLLRLAEIHLMYAEAQLALGKPDVAAESLTLFLERQNLSGNITEALLHELALKEMSREGVSFINMRRWGIAAQRLSGFNHPKFNLLPIPASTIQISPYIIQNEGYP